MMKKLLFTALFCIVYLLSIGQQRYQLGTTSPKRDVETISDHYMKNVLYLGRKPDTNFTPSQAGAIIFRTADKKYYGFDGQYWTDLGGGVDKKAFRLITQYNDSIAWFHNGLNDSVPFKVVTTGVRYTTDTGSSNNTVVGWGLNGNAGTNPSTNYIGTNDNQDISFKRNNVEMMRMKNYGINFFQNEVTGLRGIATGQFTSAGGFSFTNGQYDTTGANYSMTTGSFLRSNFASELVIGEYNDLTSVSAGRDNERVFEVGVGTSSNRANAMTILKSGNVGIGTTTPNYQLTTAGEANINGLLIGRGGGTIFDIRIGSFFTPFNTTASGGNNLSIGLAAMNNVTPISGSTFSYNTALGAGALANRNRMGNYNVAIGAGALQTGSAARLGSYNIGIGVSTLLFSGSTDGVDRNIAIGYYAGSQALSGFNYNYSRSIIIGDSINFPRNEANQLNIGNIIYGKNLDGYLNNVSSGYIGIGVNNPAYKLDVNGTTQSSQYKLSALNTAPTSSTDTGATGEIRITSGYIYVCIATNTWVRSSLSTF